jgi:hypothetical protein
MRADLTYDLSRTHVVHAQMLVDLRCYVSGILQFATLDSHCQHRQQCFTLYDVNSLHAHQVISSHHVSSI